MGPGAAIDTNTTAAKRPDGYKLFHSAQWQVVEERNAANQTTTQYVWSPVYVDAMVLRDKDNNADGDVTDAGERHYVTHDANFNITALTESAGNVVERYLYDPYGQQTVLDANWAADADNTSDYAFTHGHQGGKVDPDTGLIHFRHRDYSPALGRWVQQDPMGYVDGQNRYEYVRGAPLQLVDGMGLWGDGVHRDRTTLWAGELGISQEAAGVIGRANASVDNAIPQLGQVGLVGFTPTSPLPTIAGGDQAWHFDGSKGRGRDTRLVISDFELSVAKDLCEGGNAHPTSAELSAVSLGQSLHPLQDYYAHGDFGRTLKGNLWAIHNSGSKQQEFGDPANYPDDPALDAAGSRDGRATGTSLLVDGNGREWVYFIRGTKRITDTRNATMRRLREFIDFAKRKGSACCCTYFGIRRNGGG